MKTKKRSAAPFPVLPSRHYDTDKIGVFAAKLLFEFYITVNGDEGIMRLCEDRIVLIRAPSANHALREANREGRAAQYRDANGGSPLHFRFVGVMDLFRLGIECQDNEVWYDIVVRKRPMERREKLVPPPGEAECNPRGTETARGRQERQTALAAISCSASGTPGTGGTSMKQTRLSIDA